MFPCPSISKQVAMIIPVFMRRYIFNGFGKQYFLEYACWLPFSLFSFSSRRGNGYIFMLRCWIFLLPCSLLWILFVTFFSKNIREYEITASRWSLHLCYTFKLVHFATH